MTLRTPPMTTEVDLNGSSCAIRLMNGRKKAINSFKVNGSLEGVTIAQL